MHDDDCPCPRLSHIRAVLFLFLVFLPGCVSQNAAPTLQPPPQAAAPPETQPFFSQNGIASFYAASFDGKTRADGGRFDETQFTAAHRSLAFGTVVRVTNLGNGRSVKVEINDRGPRIKNRIIDLSPAAARALGMQIKGIAHVRLEAFAADQQQMEN